MIGQLTDAANPDVDENEPSLATLGRAQSHGQRQPRRLQRFALWEAEHHRQEQPLAAQEGWELDKKSILLEGSWPFVYPLQHFFSSPPASLAAAPTPIPLDRRQACLASLSATLASALNDQSRKHLASW